MSSATLPIQGKVKANAGLLAKIISGEGDISASRQEELYVGIPFEKLPDNIPTVSMCKSELVKILLARKKVTINTCRHADFGQEGWKKQETYTDSSGRLDGGHDQNWWCLSRRYFQRSAERMGGYSRSGRSLPGSAAHRHHDADRTLALPDNWRIRQVRAVDRSAAASTWASRVPEHRGSASGVAP